MTLRSLLFLAILFSIAAITSCKSKKELPQKKGSTPVAVDVLVASYMPLDESVVATGSIVPSEFLEIHPEVSGRLTMLNIREGSHVGKGAILARVNDADLRAQVGKSRAQLALAQKTVERYKFLLDAGGLNQSDYDIAVTQLNSTRADIAYTMALINKTIIRAPFSGLIGLRQVSPGAYVTPQTILATLQQIDVVKIDFTVPEMYADQIKQGNIIDVEFADKSKTGRAKIIAIEPVANEATRNIKARAALLGDDPVPGGYVKVKISATTPRQAIMVPADCLIPEDKSNKVIVIKNGKANFTNIETGLRQANLVEVKSGLEAGDSVVVTGVLFARPDSKVNIRKVETLNTLIKTNTE